MVVKTGRFLGDLMDAVVIAFTSIAAFTTIAFVIATTFRYRPSWRPRSALKAAVLASEAFRSSLAQISRSDAFYEPTINVLNTLVCTNACIALLYLLKYDDEKHDCHRGIIGYAMGFAGVLFFSFSVAATVELYKFDKNSMDQYKDWACALLLPALTTALHLLSGQFGSHGPS
ncbi:hypothetical protein QBC34DRAFT_431290 [Podospora aff. communis PSN243]|uniref:MARVEL domain-containing protein n=1 Tax=Podospora aff. communis PSN243 TaxID=3040156 RepID=A0AAV9G6A7_9PEZI|nr:hypothetical protein QBC34DRAFT_431290 [Podospora aff. communis PSN243]